MVNIPGHSFYKSEGCHSHEIWSLTIMHNTTISMKSLVIAYHSLSMVILCGTSEVSVMAQRI